MIYTYSMRAKMIASANRRILAKQAALDNCKHNSNPIYDGVEISEADLLESIESDLNVIRDINKLEY